MVIPESTRLALVTIGLLSQRKKPTETLFSCYPPYSLKPSKKKKTICPLSQLSCFLFPSLSYFSLPQQATTHSPIRPSACMASSNHPHGQPCLWPINHAAHLMHGEVPPFFHKYNEKEPPNHSPGPPHFKRALHTYIPHFFFL